MLSGLRGHISVRSGAALLATGRLSGLRGHVTLRSGVVLRTSGQLSGLRGFVTARYDSNTERPTVCQVRARWQSAAPMLAGIASHYQVSQPLAVGIVVRAQDAQPVQRATRSRWQSSLALPLSVRTRYEAAQSLQRATRSRWQSSLAICNAVGSGFETALQVPAQPVRSRFQEALRDRISTIKSYCQDADFVEAVTRHVGGQALQLDRRWAARWQAAWAPRPGRMSVPIDALPEPCYVPDANLLFDAPWSAGANLVFICERHVVVPPPRHGHRAHS